MTKRPLTLSLAALLLVSARPASAQTASSSAPTPPPPPPLGSMAPLPEAPVQIVAELGFDLGFEKLLEVEMNDGSTRSLKANQGINGSIGAAFLKLDGGRFATQATIGIEYSAIDASNGSARWLAFPFEVKEVVYLDPLRLGAGLSYLLAPSIKGDGFFEGLDVDLQSSVGLVLEADWVWRNRQSARGARYTLGVRYTVQSIEPKSGGSSVDANALGFVLGFTG